MSGNRLEAHAALCNLACLCKSEIPPSSSLPVHDTSPPVAYRV